MLGWNAGKAVALTPTTEIATSRKAQGYVPKAPMLRTVALGHVGKHTRPTTRGVLAMRWLATLVLDITAPPWIHLALQVLAQRRHPMGHASFGVREDAALITQAACTQTVAATPTTESATSRNFAAWEPIVAIATIAVVDIVEWEPSRRP